MIDFCFIFVKIMILELSLIVALYRTLNSVLFVIEALSLEGFGLSVKIWEGLHLSGIHRIWIDFMPALTLLFLELIVFSL